MPEYKTVRGMRDLLFEETSQLNFIVQKARETSKEYSYGEVVTPLVESNELLSAKSGDEIRNRMFTFKDLGDRTVSLRPEFTSSIARLFTNVYKKRPKPVRLFSIGSVYRYDEPQLGRYREFWQSNYELIGSNKPEADAELILLTNNFFKKSGLKNHFFRIGHIGILKGILNQEKIDEKTQNKVLQFMDKKDYSKAFNFINNSCKSIFEDLINIKANSIFDKIEKIRNQLSDYQEAKESVENLSEILKIVMRCDCPINSIDPVFSRGLEYYTGIIFEVQIPKLNISLGGGGRYDRLIELFGGSSTPAVGVAHGLDRIRLALQLQKVQHEDNDLKKVLVIPVTENLKIRAIEISEKLRQAGISTELDVMGRKITKGLQYANKQNMDYVIIVGESEIKNNSVALKDLAKREQIIIKIKNLIKKIKE
jgi:histidyl-tRNA synthetase